MTRLAASVLLLNVSLAYGASTDAPSNLRVWAGERSVSVAWNSAGRGVRYDLRYSSDGAIWIDISGVGSPTVGRRVYEVIDGLTNDTEYTVQLRARMGQSASDWTASVVVTPAEAPEAPSDRLSLPEATEVPLGVPLRASLNSTSDVDYFYLSPLEEEKCLAIMTGGRIKNDILAVTQYKKRAIGGGFYSYLETTLQLTNTRVPDGEFRDTLIFFKAPASDRGLYFGVESSDGGTGDYTLYVSEFGDPDLTHVSGVTGHELECDSDADRPVELAVGVPALSLLALEVIRETFITGEEFVYGLDLDWFKFTLEERTPVMVRAWTRLGVRIGIYEESACCPDWVGGITGEGTVAFGEGALFSSSYGSPCVQADLDAGTYYVRLQRSTSPRQGDENTPVVVFMTRPSEEEELVMGELRGYYGIPHVGNVSRGKSDSYRLSLDTRIGVFIRGYGDGGPAARVRVLDASGSAVGHYRYDEPFWKGGPSGFTVTGVLDRGEYTMEVRSSSSRSWPYILLGITDPSQQFRDRCGPTELSDPDAGCSWHLINSGSGIDINVKDVWDEYDGSGIVVGVVDDSLDTQHVDLRENILKGGHKDFSGDGNLLGLWSSHGTQVAGLIAARDNTFGSRGVAPRAKIWGANFVGNEVTVGVRSTAMAHNVRSTAVSNNSWGLGGGFTGPWYVDELWKKAIDQGVTRGYGGRGVAYVFAGGNRRQGDESTRYSTIDEIPSHYGVMAVCAVARSGVPTGYSAYGANLLVCGPSGGDDIAPGPGLMTTFPYSRYLDTFNGTSGSAPIVAGVVALIRQARPDLTWRDVKLVLAGSARRLNLNDGSWTFGQWKYEGGRSYYHSHKYGFGLVDAGAAVDLAKKWKRVGAMRTTVSDTERPELTIKDGNQLVPDPALTLPPGRYSWDRDPHYDVVDELWIRDSPVSFIEHVRADVHVEATYTHYRDLRIELESPWGTRSLLSVPTRTGPIGIPGVEPPTRSYEVYHGTVRHIGESANGIWKLRIRDERKNGSEAKLKSWRLVVYGHEFGSPPAALNPLPPLGGSAEEDDDDDGGEGGSPPRREGSPSCRTYVTPYWQGPGGIVVKAYDGPRGSVEVGSDCSIVPRTYTADERGLLVSRIEDHSCSNGHVIEKLEVSRAEPGGWYWLVRDGNVAVAPLVCKEDSGSVEAHDPGGLEVLRNGYGTLFRHENGLMGVVPHGTESDGEELYVTPYWRGSGGFVLKPAGDSVRVKIECGRTYSTNRLYPREDGYVVELVRKSYCTDHEGNPKAGKITVTGAEGGGWYWIAGEKNVAVAPFLLESQLGTVPAVNPGGLVIDRREAGTLFLREPDNLIGIVPHQ